MSIGQGTKLGPYEVQDFIGQGAMGVVYRAYHAQLERTGAIKVMQAITPDLDTVARFRHEAQAIAKLRHPNIVDVYDFGEFQGTPYMIVEYIPGGSLASVMERGPLDRATALKYLRGIAAGLDYAHSHGVVHRDIKPANVLLTNEGTPVLADFGLAKLLQGSSLKSMTGVTTGTPAYMAPEQVTGHQVGPAADRYSLATIAYEMLTGVIPFDGESLMELLYAQVHRRPAAPSSRDATLGPEVDEVLMRGLAKDPAARWGSASDFVEALAAALTPAPAAPTKAFTRTMVMAPPLAPDRSFTSTIATPPETRMFDPETVDVAYPSPPPAVLQPKRSHRGRLMIGIAAILLLLLFLGVCAVLTQATTLAVNPGRTVQGGRVTVTATHVPGNQVGEIQLLSTVHTYFFRADSNGDVSVEIAVPSDIEPGMHHVRICWSGTCPKEVVLRVVSDVALSSPTPVTDATPASSPTATPLPSAGSTPTARPTPTPSQRPTPTPAPSITLVSVTATTHAVRGKTRVTFNNFYAGSAVLYVCQGASSTCKSAGTLPVPAASSTTITFETPDGIVAAAQTYVVACGNPCMISTKKPAL